MVNTSAPIGTTSVSEIRAGARVATLINVFTVSPENQQDLVDILEHATRDTIRFLPGFVSANIHRSLDGTRVTNYAQWETAQAMQAMLANPALQPHLDAARALASNEPHLYEVTSVHRAGTASA
jgi:quinol monooxygenase YgiN